MAMKKTKVERVMGEYKRGKLTTHGKKVTNQKQAIAIALSEAGKTQKKAKGGKVSVVL